MLIIDKIDQVSRDMWTKIPLAKTHKVHYGEETISDILLLELAQCYNAQVYNNVKTQRYIKVHQTTKKEESLFGADWIWYIGSPFGKWIGIAIQAKKIDPIKKNGDYKYIDHTVKSAKKKQIDIFEQFSTNNKLLPFYCFYNHFEILPNEINSYWRPQFNPCDEELLGWTVTPLNIVKNILKNKEPRNFKYIHSQTETIPVKYLFQYLFENLKNKTNSSGLTNFNNYLIDDLPKELKTHTSSLTDEQLEKMYGNGLKPKRIVKFDLKDEISFLKN